MSIVKFFEGTLCVFLILYFVFIGNFLYRTYEHPKQAFYYSWLDIKSGEIPLIMKWPISYYFENRRYLSGLHDYDKYQEYNMGVINNVRSINSLSRLDNYDNSGEEYKRYKSQLEYERYEEGLSNENYSNPGVHEVSGYTRADGVEVDGYLRTNPDGIEENNFSYRGR